MAESFAEESASSSKQDSFTQNSRVYMITLIAYCGIFLFGYDTGVAGGIVGLQSFTDSFGYTKLPAKTIAEYKSWIVSILMLGAFAGAITAAPMCQALGRKKGLFIATFIFLVGSAIQTAATHSYAQMLVGRFVGGLGVGGMSISEFAPKEIRGRITGLFQVTVAVGVAISYWITYGMTVHHPGTVFQWRFPLAFQLIPSAIMLGLLPFIVESPRWLIYKGRDEEALKNMAWARKRSITDSRVVEEIAEITAAIKEEREATSGGTNLKEAWAKGNRKRFFIAFALFFLQQWSGQNSISYYSPLIFQSIGITGTSTGLLASGIYGLVKIVATYIYIFFGVDKIGRSKSFGFGALGMGLFLWIIGAIYYTHPADPKALTPSSSSIAMAAMIYCFVIPYCFSWGPLPWLYSAEIFPMRLRPYGMAVAASTQWIFNFCITKITPTLVLDLPNGKLFFLFASINMLSACFGFWLPETSGVSLEEMDVLFGAVTREERDRYIQQQLRGVASPDMSDDGKQKIQHLP